MPIIVPVPPGGVGAPGGGGITPGGPGSFQFEIDPGGIASAEAFGNPALVLNLGVVGIPSGEVVQGGVVIPPLMTIVQVGDIASAETFGTAQLNQTIYPVGVTSGETFGAGFVAKDVQITLLSGIASLETFGVATLQQSIVPSGIPGGEAFGIPLIQFTQVSIFPGGIASGQAFGVARLSTQINVVGIDSAEFVQGPVVVPPLTTILAAGDIASAEAFGIPSVQISQLVINVSGIASGEVFGPVVVIPTTSSTPSGATVLLSLEDEGEETMGLPVYYEFFADVVPSNSVNFDYPCRAIYVGTGGDIQAVRGDGTVVTFKAVPTGALLRVEALRVNSTNTTAAFMVQMR